MNKKRMNALIDPALAKKIQLLVNDPAFPGLDVAENLGPRALVRALWDKHDWEPEAQPLFLLRLWAAVATEQLAEYIHERAAEPVCFMNLYEFASGFWDRKQALSSLEKDELFFRFHTYAALFDLSVPLLKNITAGALELVESSGRVEIDYRFWQITQGLAA